MMPIWVGAKFTQGRKFGDGIPDSKSIKVIGIGCLEQIYAEGAAKS